MAKKNVKNLELTVETDKSKVTVQKKEKKVKVEVDTPNVDVTVNKDENSKEFILDSKKLDITVKKDENNTTVEVKSENGILKQVGKVLSKIILKRFNK